MTITIYPYAVTKVSLVAYILYNTILAQGYYFTSYNLMFVMHAINKTVFTQTIHEAMGKCLDTFQSDCTHLSFFFIMFE